MINIFLLRIDIETVLCAYATHDKYLTLIQGLYEVVDDIEKISLNGHSNLFGMAKPGYCCKGGKISFYRSYAPDKLTL